MQEIGTMIEPILTNNLLSLATAFAKAKGQKLSSVARRCHGTVTFFDDLAAGQVSFTVRKYDEMIGWLIANWPQGAEKLPGPFQPRPTQSTDHANIHPATGRPPSSSNRTDDGRAQPRARPKKVA